ncbi:alkaline phosphatase family protein [Nodosilinea nodulosa]|uniref:alkaline phosphatase family protein n=1 Tax=Nodosilinea nodulosa TaxID=416001 RepID=UPI0002FFFDE8|nr:alkaline phosphatase family protein [Nodosilinea nodulosa]
MARNIVVFVADGLRPGSVNPTDAPTLYSIRQDGVNFSNSHSLFPTFTTPNASAIATGHYLGDTGDFSNTVYTGYPVPNANGSVTPFIENDPILTDLNANSNLADPDTSFSSNNFLTEESLLAYARLNGYSTAAIGKLGPVAIQDVSQLQRTDGLASANITPDTVIIDDSTNGVTPPTSAATGSQAAVPLSQDIADRLTAAGLAVVPTARVQPSGNLTTAGTLNANTAQQQYFADATTKAVLPQFVADIASGNSNGFATVYWSRDPDGTQHNNGDAFNAADPGNNFLDIGINGPTSKAAVANADANLKQIIDYLKATPDPQNPGHSLYENTDIFVTADHGFSTISKQAVGVTFDAAGNPTYTNTTSYSSTLSYYTTDSAGNQTPTVHAGFLPPGFVAIDLAHDLGSTLYDPSKPTAPVDSSNINNIQYAVVDPTAGQTPANGNGVIGGSGTVVDGVIDPGTQVVVAANGGSDLLYVPSNDPALVKQIVSLLAQKDYISGIFTDDKFGDVPGALKLSTIGLEGTAELATPSIVVNFKTFSTNPNDPNDPQAEVQVADTGLQQGQGMHGSFGRGDTFNNMAAIGPDFKTGFVDTAPVSNADVAPTLASLLGWELPAVGSLTGRVIEESLVNGPDSVASTASTLVSAPVDGAETILNLQTVGNVPYFDAAGFAGGTDGLVVPAEVPQPPSMGAIPTQLAPVGTAGDDVLVAIPGTAFTGQGNLLYAGAGNDTVDTAIAGAAAGNNWINLGSGDDSIFVANGDRAFGVSGNDTLDATDAEQYRISGGRGDDTFFLGASGYALGGEGSDRFFVGSGGDNLLSGGSGADQFWIVNAELPSAPNCILDFEMGTDVIGIQGASSLGISAATLAFTQIGANTSIDFGNQTLAVLSGVQASSLNAADTSQFIFA